MSPFPVACVPNAGLPDENGKYLETLRDEFSTPKKPTSLWSLSPKDKFTRHQELSVVLALFQKMRRLEGCKSYYSEMMEDVMENIQDVKVKEVVKYAKYISTNWGMAPPHIEELVDFFKKEIVKLDNIDEINSFRTAVLLVCLFSLYKSLVYPLKEDLVIPPKVRWYRTMPKKTAKKQKPKPMATFYNDW
jgi:hypothetical protein